MTFSMREEKKEIRGRRCHTSVGADKMNCPGAAAKYGSAMLPRRREWYRGKKKDE